MPKFKIQHFSNCPLFTTLNCKANEDTFNGIALIKPYLHSKETDVNEAIVYDSYFYRPTYSTLKFNGLDQNIETGRIVKLYTIANPDHFLNISNDSDIKDIKLSAPRIEYVLKQFKLSESLRDILKNRLNSLQTCIKEYDLNKIRKGGIWLDKAEYLANVNTKAERERLRVEEEKIKKDTEEKRIAEEIRIKSENREKEQENLKKSIIQNLKSEIDSLQLK